MKSAYIGIIAVMLIVIAIACAGCASQTTTTSSGGSGPSSSGSSSSAPASSTQQVGSTVSSSSVFGSSYNWMEYHTTTTSQGNEMAIDMKMERSTSTYNGQPAVEMKVTMTSSAMNGVYDYYYDSAMNSILGGTMTMTVNGKTMTLAIPAAQLNQMSATNFNKESTLTFAGIESVTVPAGTYPTASKYTKSENGATVTFWSAPGVPVPVQISSSTATGSTTSELVGWG